MAFGSNHEVGRVPTHAQFVHASVHGLCMQAIIACDGQGMRTIKRMQQSMPVAISASAQSAHAADDAWSILRMRDHDGQLEFELENWSFELDQSSSVSEL